MKCVKSRSAVLSVLATTLVLTSCGSPGPLTLKLATSQGASGANRTMEAAADFAIPDNLSSIEYSVVGNLSTPRISGFAFSIGSKPDAKDWLRRLASALNVPGDIVKESKNNFTIGLNKDTGAGVWLWADDAGSWWSYYPGGASTSMSSPPCDPSATDCRQEAPLPPTNLLSVEDAVASATRFLIQVGFELKGFRLRGTKNEWSTNVEGELVVAAVPTNLTFSFSFGENGVMTSASGPLVTLKQANGYYIITPEEGVKRLGDPRFTGFSGATRIAVDVASKNQSTNSTQTKISIPINRVEYTLMQAVLANTTTILVPAYTYFNEDGVVGSVIAMKEENLTFADAPPNTDEPTPLNTAGASTSGNTGSGSAPSAGTGAITLPTPELIQQLVGLSEAEATKVAASYGWIVRVVKRNGESLQVTTDYSTSRVNFIIEKDKVAEVTIG